MSARPLVTRISAAVVLLIGVGVAFAVFGLNARAAVVLSPSMRPDFRPGDMILTKPIPVASVRPGMVVEFIPPGEGAAFTHRVVTVSRHDGATVITTRGDANPAPDPWHARLNGTTVPEVIGVIPKLGYVANSLHQRNTRLILIGLLGGLLTAFGAITTYSQMSGRAATRLT